MEIGLKQVAVYVARWRETGRVPAIERGIALERMQKIYAELSELPCTDKASVEEYMPIPQSGGYDGVAPDDESFEVNSPATVSVAVAGEEEMSEQVQTFAAEEIATEERMSQTSHTVQEVGEQDPCPSQTRFLEDRETNLSFAAAPATVPEQEVEEEEPVEAPDEEEAQEEEGGRSEETFLMQENGSRDECPQATEVPDADKEGEVEPEPEQTPANAKKREPKRAGTPRIFGIEVSPYARHELIDTLFHGNQAMFDSECEKIDAMDSLEEALVYIGETYQWIPENAATIKFIDLLEARFRTDEEE